MVPSDRWGKPLPPPTSPNTIQATTSEPPPAHSGFFVLAWSWSQGYKMAMIYGVLRKCPLNPAQGREEGVWASSWGPSSNWVAWSVTQTQDSHQQVAHGILGKHEAVGEKGIHPV